MNNLKALKTNKSLGFYPRILKVESENIADILTFKFISFWNCSIMSLIYSNF